MSGELRCVEDGSQGSVGTDAGRGAGRCSDAEAMAESKKKSSEEDFGGTVAFAATLPSSADPCSPSGSSIVYAIDLGTGQSRFANNATYFDPGSAVTDVQFVETDGKPTLIVSVDRKCTGDSCNPNCSGNLCAPPVPPPNGVGPKLLNWREVPLRNATGGTL